MMRLTMDVLDPRWLIAPLVETPTHLRRTKRPELGIALIDLSKVP
jgi:hypothetical protein